MDSEKRLRQTRSQSTRRCVGPEILQREVLASRGVEDVDDDVAVVLHDPLTGRISLNRQPRVADFLHGRVDFFGNGVYLTPAGAGDEDKEII